MELEEQIAAYRELAKKIRELEEQKKALSAMILQQMDTKILHVANYVVRRYNRLSIKLSLEEARILDSVKMEEVIDKDRIKSLYEAGNSIPGVTEIQWVQVSEKNTAEV